MAASLWIQNPHSIWAALVHRPKAILRIFFPENKLVLLQKKTDTTDLWVKIYRRADQLGLVSSVPLQQRGEPEGVFAEIQPKSPEGLEGFFRNAQPGQTWWVLDHLQDPHNVGAVFRSAAFFGVRGIVLSQHRSSPLSGTVYDASCGGVEELPFVTGFNSSRVFEVAKNAGCWILGTSEHASLSYLQIQPDRPWLVVIGNEEEGVRRLVLERCDQVCQIPPRGQGVTSLNVSVASGILMSHLQSRPS